MSEQTYLGETDVDIATSGFANLTPSDWAIYFIERFGQYDGGHHKQWTMDQVVRILKGSPVIVKEASWSTGEKEYRVSVGEPTQEYKDWAIAMKGDWDAEEEEFEYDYDEGIAP